MPNLRSGLTQELPKSGSSKKKTPSNLLNLKSFLPDTAVHKPSPEEIAAKKEEEMRKRREKEEEALMRKEELKRAKIEEKKQQREARQRKVQEAREAQEKQRMLTKQNQEKETREKLNALNKLRETRAKAEAEQKKADHEKKMHEAEERRRREEAELKEKRRQEEEHRKQIEAKRKHDEEESKRLDEKRKREAEANRKKQAQQEEEAKREEERRRREEEAEKKRIAAKEAEDKRAREEAIKQQKERLAKLREAAKVTKVMNTTYEKTANTTVNNATFNSNESQLNSTYTKPAAPAASKTTVQSYDITPARHELPPEPLKDEDNYDIGDIRSDDDTDDEDAPRKVIPQWAMGKKSQADFVYIFSFTTFFLTTFQEANSVLCSCTNATTPRTSMTSFLSWRSLRIWVRFSRRKSGDFTREPRARSGARRRNLTNGSLHFPMTDDCMKINQTNSEYNNNITKLFTQFDTQFLKY